MGALFTDNESRLGVSDGARTRNIQLGKLALYQLSYTHILRFLSAEGSPSNHEGLV